MHSTGLGAAAGSGSPKKHSNVPKKTPAIAVPTSKPAGTRGTAQPNIRSGPGLTGFSIHGLSITQAPKFIEKTKLSISLTLRWVESRMGPQYGMGRLAHGGRTRSLHSRPRRRARGAASRVG